MVVIRQTSEADVGLLPGIEQSAGEAFREIASLAWIADDEVMSVERHTAFVKQGAAWVAVDEHNNVVGFLSAERRTDTLHIWQMAVHSNHQKKGIGRCLIDTARQWAAREGMSSLTLTTFRNVAWNAPFYRSCGFRMIEDELPHSLEAILQAEQAAGLPRDQRCAMIAEAKT